MDPQPVLVHEPRAVVPPESLVVEVVRVTPPDAECAIGMCLLAIVGGAVLVGKVVSTTWEADSQVYIVVFSNGRNVSMLLHEVLAFHQRFAAANPQVAPIRIAIQDKVLGWQFEANEGDMKDILRRSAFPGSAVVGYVDADVRSAVGVSVAQSYDDRMHIGICFGKQVMLGQLVYLVIFDDGECKGMSYGFMKRAAERFWRGYSVGGCVSIRAVL